MTRISKSQLMGATTDFARQYLGFEINLPGRNWSIERLEKRMNAYADMAELSRRAKEIFDRYTPEQRIAFALSGKYPADALEAQECSRKANDIWLERF